MLRDQKIANLKHRRYQQIISRLFKNNNKQNYTEIEFFVTYRDRIIQLFD